MTGKRQQTLLGQVNIRDKKSIRTLYIHSMHIYLLYHTYGSTMCVRAETVLTTSFKLKEKNYENEFFFPFFFPPLLFVLSFRKLTRRVRKTTCCKHDRGTIPISQTVNYGKRLSFLYIYIYNDLTMFLSGNRSFRFPSLIDWINLTPLLYAFFRTVSIWNPVPRIILSFLRNLTREARW